MHIDQMFPRKYHTTADFPQPNAMTIRTVETEQAGDDLENKPVVHFHESLLGWVFNKTSA